MRVLRLGAAHDSAASHSAASDSAASDSAASDIAASGYGPFTLEVADSLDAIAGSLLATVPDALLLHCTDAAPLLTWPALSLAVIDAAVVVVAPLEPAAAVRLLQIGVQDVLSPRAGAEAVARSLRLAIERKRVERAARKAYATDLSTGLPHHDQLLEHMNHLLALREREPAPMALVVLRIDGLVRVADTLGVESANVLRRKAAVRLRAALRASDVVASIGSDTYAVLLAHIEAADDGGRVAAKLAHALRQSFNVAGRRQTLAVSAGLASYPEHGKAAEGLLRRALGQAASVATVGANGIASAADRGPAAAANDVDG